MILIPQGKDVVTDYPLRLVVSIRYYLRDGAQQLVWVTPTKINKPVLLKKGSQPRAAQAGFSPKLGRGTGKRGG